MTTDAPTILPGSQAETGSAIVVNIFGGPGSGKSTLASRLFFELKRHRIEAACPEEHAKLALWSGQPWLLDQQTVLMGRTWETIHALHDKVDAIIVDSPLLLSSVYAGPREPDCFHALCAHLHKRPARMNIFLSRDPGADYSTNGRRETADEARLVDDRILETLGRESETFSRISRDLIDIDIFVRAISAARR